MFPKQRERIELLDRHVQDLADQLAGAVEDDDAVADGAADELNDRGVGRLLAGDFARAFDQNLHLRPRYGWLSSRQIAFCTASSSLFRRRLTSSGMSSAKSSAAFVPGRALYLKMKLFLKRASRTSSIDLLEILLRLAAKADDEIARHRRVRESSRGCGRASRDIPRPCSRVSSASSISFEPLCAGTCR